MVCLAFGFATLFWSVLQPWWTFPWSLLGDQTSLLGNLSEYSAPIWAALRRASSSGGTIIPFALMIGALAHLPATQVGVAAMTEPVVATIVAWAWLGESLAPAQIIGGVIVLHRHRARPDRPLTSSC